MTKPSTRIVSAAAVGVFVFVAQAAYAQQPSSTVSVSGSGFTLSTLTTGATAFRNRGYVWENVPPSISGWRYTQTGGGVDAQIDATPSDVGSLVIASRSGGADFPGWQRQDSLKFTYSSPRHEVMYVYTRSVAAGIILRVEKRGIGKAAMVEISADGSRATFDPASDYIDFPSGDAKFSIRFDEKSRRYWSLADDQLIAGANRNALVLTSSADLKTWRIDATVLQNPDPNFVGIQYVDFRFDGPDIVYVSRTAWGGAHSYHDANYETFGRIIDFRTTVSTP